MCQYKQLHHYHDSLVNDHTFGVLVYPSVCVVCVCVCVRVDNLHVHICLRFHAYIIIVCVFVWVYPYLPHLVPVQISTHCWRFVIIAFSLNPNTLYKPLVVQESLLCLLSVCVYTVHVI